jgi:hypothetical protein
MARACYLSLVAGLVVAAQVPAQDAGAWRYRWQKGQVLTYRVQHHTSVAEVVAGSKVETGSKLALLKRWQVADVDAGGVATLHLTLLAMRHEQTRPDGETLLFDSANPDKSTPELRESMAEFIGKTLAILKVDGQGRVLEVQKGNANGYESEPPFALVLPSKAPTAEGQYWERRYHITLDPPQGTGEKFAAAQKYQVTQITPTQTTVAVTTECRMPESVADRIPLLQKHNEGEIAFDIQSGRILSVRYTINKELQNHQGEGSTYQFRSSYSEQLVRD